MRCPNCGTINPAEEQLTFCKKCGAELRTVCPRCSADNPSDAEHCSECGLELHPDRGHERTAGIRVDEYQDILGNVLKTRPTMSSGVLAAAIGVLVLMWIPVFVTLKNRAKLKGCQSNLKQLVVAMRAYANDNDGHAPTAYDWSDLIMPYLYDRNALNCPARPGKVGYAFNLSLNETPLAHLTNAGTLIAFFESDNEKAMSGTQGLWLTKPAHSKGNNVAFADGTVRQTLNIPADHYWQAKSAMPSALPELPPNSAPGPKTANPVTSGAAPINSPVGAPTGSPSGSPSGSPTNSAALSLETSAPANPPLNPPPPGAATNPPPPN